MVFQRVAPVVAGALLLLAPAAAAGQQPSIPSPGAEPAEAPAPDPAAPAADSPCCTLPARTPIEIELLETVNSKANRTGQHFSFRLAAPLMVDGRVVVPAGVPGVGEIVHAERARFGGRAGELILAARYLDHAGTRITLRTLRFGPQQGRDSSGAINNMNLAAVAVMPPLAMLGYLIAGGEVNVPAGTRATAQTAAEITLAPAE